MNDVTVIKEGFLATVQDLGRESGFSQGLPAGGAMDKCSLKLANDLLGNEVMDAGIEFCQIPPELLFSVDTHIVVMANSEVRINGVKRSPFIVHRVFAGEVLEITPLQKGVWGYVAVLGGVAVPLISGSASTHPHLRLGGIEGRVFKKGDVLPLRSDITVDEWRALKGVSRELQTPLESRVIRCVLGAQENWFSSESKQRFFSAPYRISKTANRVGYRVEGAPLQRREEFHSLELESEGAVAGTVQISNDGLPIVLMADSQLLGGYPKVAHVIEADLGAFAQLPAGSEFYFQQVTYQEAAALRDEKKSLREQFLLGLSLR